MCRLLVLPDVMTLAEFRSLREELKYIPCETDEIEEKLMIKNFISNCLATAMKALNIAEEIITKQADVVLQSVHELTACMKENRTRSSSEPPVSSIISNKINERIFDTSDKFDNHESSLPEIDNSMPKITSTAKKHRPKGYVTNDENEKCGYNATEDSLSIGDISSDDFTKVQSRRKRFRKRSNAVVGRKTVACLGTRARARRFDVFISRLGPNVTAAAVQEFCQAILCEDCEVSKLKTKFDSYSSFKITCSIWKKAEILNPDSWEYGVLIRPFYTSF